MAGRSPEAYINPSHWSVHKGASIRNLGFTAEVQHYCNMVFFSSYTLIFSIFSSCQQQLIKQDLMGS